MTDLTPLRRAIEDSMQDIGLCGFCITGLHTVTVNGEVMSDD